MTDPAWQAAVREGAAAAYDESGVLEKHGFGFEDLPQACGSEIGTGLQGKLCAAAELVLRTALATLERHGYVLVPKEATGEMVDAASDTPEGKMVDGLIVLAYVHGQHHPPLPKDDTLLHRWYRAMLAARPSIVPVAQDG